MSTEDQNKPSSTQVFWLCAGIGVLLVLGAGAYRLAMGSNVDFSAPGINLKIDEVREELEKTSKQVSEANEKLSQQYQEVEAAKQALTEKESKLNRLVIQLRQQSVGSSTPLPPRFQAELTELSRQSPRIEWKNSVSPDTFTNIEARLEHIDSLKQKL